MLTPLPVNIGGMAYDVVRR